MSRREMDPWHRPRHSEIRAAINELGAGGFDEIRVALHTGCEPFEQQMKRRMKTRRVELRGAYKVLHKAGEEKVRFHLAAIDMTGLSAGNKRQRRKQRAKTRETTPV